MVKSPQDFAAGLALVIIGALAWLAAFPLPFSQVGGVGSGMLPKATGAILAGLGVLILMGSFLKQGEQLTRWNWREIGLILGGVMVFALTIRGFNIPSLKVAIPPLGLAVSGPLLILIASRADRSARIVESLIFALLLTGACILLFRFLLGLPIPVFPPLLGY